ncbi:hypothetical protein ACFWXH_03495 [Mesorhizobium sp. NPDC059054]|uniref:hypothetical protein n=1 Tax=Mesorhizobium sp. NPDC059054 TaxID=3346711 RepID=UPI003689A68C
MLSAAAMQPKAMISSGRHSPSRPWPKWLGWFGVAILVAAIPGALAAVTMPANEYKAWGVDALDCDGPISVFLFAIPTLLIYSAGAIVNGCYFRNRLNLVFAVFCTLVGALIVANIAAAVGEQVQLERDLQACR